MAEQAPVVNEPVVPQDATPTASTPVEITSTEVAQDADFDKGFDDGETPPVNKVQEAEDVDEPLDLDPVEEEPTTEVEPEQVEEPQSKAEDRKQQLNSEIRDLVSQRNAIREEVERLNNEVYQPATDQELLGQINPETGQYYNALEAKVASMEQRQELDRYNNQVAESQLTLKSEATRALQDFPMFDSNSTEYNAEIAASVDKILGANLKIDPNTNQVIGSNVSPYDLYKTVADAAKASALTGQIKGQQATEKMLASAEPTANAPVKVEKTDDFLKGFDTDDF